MTFLPLGADVNTAVFRVGTDRGTPYFLKLRRGNFDEVAVAVVALLHAQGIRRVMAPIATTTHRLWVYAYGFAWILYPFFEGQNGYEVALSHQSTGGLAHPFPSAPWTRPRSGTTRKLSSTPANLRML